MIWEKKRILVTVKAYPEKSSKHDQVVCTAGITDEGEWIRLYPIHVKHFLGKKGIHRYSVIECECAKAKGEKLSRKESYRVRQESIRIVDRSYYEPPVDWALRSKRILPLLSPSIESLDEMYKEDKTSLGLIRPKEILDFIATQPLEKHDIGHIEVQKTIEGDTIPILDTIPHIFKYQFRCVGCNDGSVHNIQCEDWELLESYRKWSGTYPTTDELWLKMREKYLTWMVERRDVLFFMGMHSQWPSWLIIGLYYPPKAEPESATKQLKLY